MYSATENCSIMHLNKNIKALSYCSIRFEHARSGTRSHEGKRLHEIKEMRRVLSSCSNINQPLTICIKHTARLKSDTLENYKDMPQLVHTQYNE